MYTSFFGKKQHEYLLFIITHIAPEIGQICFPNL